MDADPFIFTWMDPSSKQACMHALDTMVLWFIAVKDEVCSPSIPESTTGGRCADALNPKLLSARTLNRYVTAKRGNPGQVHVKDLPKYFEFRPSKFFSIDTQVSNPSFSIDTQVEGLGFRVFSIDTQVSNPDPWLQIVRMPQAPWAHSQRSTPNGQG